MKFRKRSFVLSFRKQWAVFLLAFILVVTQFILMFFSNRRRKPLDISQSEFFQKQYDSIRIVVEAKSNKIFPFNPNYMTDYKGYTLGISPEEIDRLLEFRSQGKFVNSAAEFQKITRIHDTLLVKLSPYFRFPEWTAKYKHVESEVQKRIKKDLNTAVLSDLEAISGIGSILAQRILKYRRFLSGFSTLDQCYEVYGLDSVVVAHLFDLFEIKSPPSIVRQSINTASLAQLSRTPYLTKEEAQKIVALRTESGKITLEDLIVALNFEDKKASRIVLYLY